MPAQIKILVEGYTNADSVAESGEEKSCPTVTLVRDGKIIMVVDPGILESQEALIGPLRAEGLDAEDVNYVCITHSHIDHYRNIGMFPNAKVVEYFGIWEKDRVSNWSENFSENIQIVPTPGHDNTGITLFVSTEEGIVAICGDVFWKENYPQDPYNDPYASNPELLARSRELVLKKAEWIIPGHAGMYRAVRGFGILNKNAKNGKNKKNKATMFCRKCRRPIKSEKDICICRPWLCSNCCQCEIDCDVCSCSHRRGK